MKIKISKEKLQKVLDNHQDSMIGLSRKLGKNDAFISQSFTRYGGEVDDVIANLICLLYDVQLADIKADTANKTDTQKAFAILREENKKNTEKNYGSARGHHASSGKNPYKNKCQHIADRTD